MLTDHSCPETLPSGNSPFSDLSSSANTPCPSPPFPTSLPCTPNHISTLMPHPASSPTNWSRFVTGTATILTSESSWSQSLFLSILRVLSDPLVPFCHLGHPSPYPSTATTLDQTTAMTPQPVSYLLPHPPQLPKCPVISTKVLAPYCLLLGAPGDLAQNAPSPVPCH